MIRYVFVFDNGMVAAFDNRQRQVPMLQGQWDDVKTKLIPAIEQALPLIDIKDALGVVGSALSDNPFCRPDCGYYCDAGQSCSCVKCFLFWHDNTYSQYSQAMRPKEIA